MEISEPLHGPDNMTQPKLEILLGTGNPGKTAEICGALQDLGIHFLTLKDFPQVLPVEESGVTYEENAILKAADYARQFGRWTLADDSGLEVDALAGAPGVLSARYAGTEASDADRIALLLDQIGNAPVHNRRARFVCALVLADSTSRVISVVHGVCEGTITTSPRGSNGFGYDPIFIPDGFDATFGELPSDVKEGISHRGKALDQMRVFLTSLLGSNLTDGVSSS
jgi:XTP/dITP diphosphohydrolase